MCKKRILKLQLRHGSTSVESIFTTFSWCTRHVLQNTLGMLIENHKHCRIPAVKRDKTTKRALMSKIIFTAFKSFPKDTHHITVPLCGRREQWTFYKTSTRRWFLSSSSAPTVKSEAQKTLYGPKRRWMKDASLHNSQNHMIDLCFFWRQNGRRSP